MKQSQELAQCKGQQLQYTVPGHEDKEGKDAISLKPTRLGQWDRIGGFIPYSLDSLSSSSYLCLIIHTFSS